MHYVIDGNNLLYATHEHFPGPAVGREQLCRIIGRWAKGCGERVTVVFDGPRPRRGVEKQMRLAGIAVGFSGARTADEVIEEMIARSRRPTAICVVTADRAIQYAARHRRCRCIDAPAFARMLPETWFSNPPPEKQRETQPKKDAPADEPNEPEKPQSISRDEAREWMRAFDYDPDEPPDEGEIMGF